MPAGRDGSEIVIKSYRAGATAVLPFRFVKPGVTTGLVIHAAAATDIILGITNLPMGYSDPLKYGEALPQIQANPGSPCDICLPGSGIWLIELAAALTEGTMVTSDATGRAVALGGTPAAGTTFFRLLAGGAIGSYQPILMNAFFKAP
jgi:hypothetical protein